jgi:hypothetical protein
MSVAKAADHHVRLARAAMVRAKAQSLEAGVAVHVIP